MSAIAIASMAMLASAVTPAMAQASSTAQRNFDISAQPLAQALMLFGRQSGLQVTAEGSVTEGRNSAPVKGEMSSSEALSTLLGGTGLTFRFAGQHGVVIMRAPQATGDAIQLGAVRVEGDEGTRVASPAQAEIGNLPAPYAGGQVARGARLGLLGNRDYMDTPYSLSSYTEQAIRDQQVTSIAEMLTTADASVRASIGSGNRYDALTIRGFRVDNDELALNGLYGLVPAYRVGPDPVERIELLKGPGALLNGMLPWGSVGGGVNIVTKRAEDAPLNRVTAEYMSDAWFGAHADIGRRFGENGEFGVRVNGAFRDGDTRIDEQTRRNTALSAGLDYRGDRLRLSADVIYQGDHMRAAARGYVPVSGITMPKAPDPKINLAQDFDYADSRSLTALGRAEFDVTPDVTLFAALGGNHFGFDKQEAPGATITSTAGDALSTSTYQQGRNHSLSGEAGVRARFATGPIDHLLVVSGSLLDQTSWFGQTRYASYATNIYHPTKLASPGAPTSSSPEEKDSTKSMRSVAVADTLSAADGLVQLTVGLRRQQFETANYAGGARTSHYDEGATTPSFALVVRPIEKLSLYANYIEALTAGATPPADAANPNQVFAPYRSKQYETGAKLDLGSFGATLGLFQIDVPSGVIDPITNVFSLDGQQRNRGIEVTGFGEIGKGVRIVGGATWLDAKLRRTQDGINDGNHAIGAPDFQANLGAEWDTPFIPGFTLTGRVIHTAKAYVTADNFAHVPDWTRFDLGARYLFDLGGKELTVRANVTNLFGKDYWEANPTGYVISGMPRTLWLSLSADL